MDDTHGAYRATLTITSDSQEDAPFLVKIAYDPPLSEKLDPVPTAYQFMSYVVEKQIMPAIAFNERYLAEMAVDDDEIFTEEPTEI